MISHPDDVASRIGRLYADSTDVSFESVIAVLPGAEVDEEVLADAIDADGRARIERRLDVSLDRYLNVVPDLPSMPIALDAAIEFSLRSMAAADGRTSDRGASAIEALISRFPSLETPIRTASMLNEALFTTGMVRRESGAAAEIELPHDYGPVMPDGRSRYELRSRLGVGGHGAVYLAVDRHLSDEGRPAYTAIKVLSAQPDASRAAPVREEAARARRVNHPNVVRVLDRGADDDGRGYIVYESVDGPTLTDYLAQRSRPLTPRESARLVAQIARGVQAAHSAGIVHCDLKPDNILMARLPSDSAPANQRDALDAWPKVTDFGIAVCLESARHAASRKAGNTRDVDAPVRGTLGFVAPEQFRGEDAALAPPADIYALGGILYYLLTGRLPSGQSAHEVRRNLEKVDGQEVRDRRGLRFDASIDRDLEAICRRALALDVQDRYASAEALARDLEAWLGHEALSWTKPTIRRRIRLFALRQPLACAMAGIVLLVAMAGGGAGVYWRMASEYRLMQAQVEAAKNLEANTAEWYERQKTMFAVTMSRFRQIRDKELTERWLSNLTLLEVYFGRQAFLGMDDPGFWNERLSVARQIVAEGRAGAAEPPLTTLMWESALAFWTLTDGSPSEARRLFARNRESWSSLSAPTDPWLQCLELLHACAIVREHFDLYASSETAPEQSLAELAHDPASPLAAAISTLQRESQVFTGQTTGGAAHRAVLRTLAELYGPGCLNEPQRRRQVLARLREFER